MDPNGTLQELVRRASQQGKETAGHHNQNHVVALTGPEARLLGREPETSVMVRIRRREALPVVIRTWDHENRILEAIKGVLPHVPQCLALGQDFTIHSYVEGVALSDVCGEGKPLDMLLIQALAGLLAQMARVDASALPPLPTCWPRDDTDSEGFLRALTHLADRQIRRPNWSGFGRLFSALGVPEDALVHLAERTPSMVRRPFSLLHADLHRGNVIVAYGCSLPLICVDWELATYGDPLHDLATHLVRMRYPSHQWPEVIGAWEEAMRRVRPAAVNGLTEDLQHYLDFERAQSVFPDVIRAAHALDKAFSQEKMDEATAEVKRALQEAAEPLHLRKVPEDREIEEALFDWLVSRHGGPGAHGDRVLEWVPDRRMNTPADFEETAVEGALSVEGAAPAARVFKGTTHLSTVVRVPGTDRPVVVRRRLAGAARREPHFLSEHAVLRALEEAGVAVNAPRVLALGATSPNGHFAIHTYVGPQDIDRRPHHPVHGLLPHEADCLVDQLCALTQVDYRRLDPTAGEPGFHRWLNNELVRLVDGLPRKTQQLARQLGLPDARRLDQILSWQQVSHRKPSLLHGDLNPWNLVRQDGPAGLTIIDWEMALIGDPLYDLVRHMHLTPTRPEIRDRMFRRWERSLPTAYTRDWQQDWQVYRRLEAVRSAYVDLDRIVSGDGLDAPNVRRAVASYAVTLAVANGALGLPVRATANPYLARSLV
ncbi:phosphotransferase [Streptomyces pseudogriseolus]|uniref:phosphotransferase n=1 Tax=Streptomyces pseudogriseolus TaxID=36817 RepID=UPI003FA1ED1E|nr:aminoglycoside phosphotransferase family protein [Streptomyces pseudogriseolus]